MRDFVLFHCVICKGSCYIIAAGNWSISVDWLLAHWLVQFLGLRSWAQVSKPVKKSTSYLRSRWSTTRQLPSWWAKYLWQSTFLNVTRKVADKKYLLNSDVRNIQRKNHMHLKFEKMTEFIFCWRTVYRNLWLGKCANLQMSDHWFVF